MKHGQEQMLFTAFVLISVNGEHDSLKQGVDLRHRDKPAKVSDVTRLGLQEEEEVPVFLCLLVIGKEALLKLCGVVEVAGDLVLLDWMSMEDRDGPTWLLTSSSAMRF